MLSDLVRMDRRAFTGMILTRVPNLEPLPDGEIEAVVLCLVCYRAAEFMRPGSGIDYAKAHPAGECPVELGQLRLEDWEE